MKIAVSTQPHCIGKTAIDSDSAEESEMELQILASMRSCVTYLRNQADCFTLGSLYRLMEEDLRLEKDALYVHKSFVKMHLVQCLEEAGNDGGSEISRETDQREDDATPVREVANASEEHASKKKKKKNDARDRKALMSDIRRALRERASYIKANSEEITMALLRRLLEQELKLEKDSLDPFKKFINKELDVVLQISDAPKRLSKPSEENIRSKGKSTQSEKVGSEEDSYSDSERDVDNEEGAAKKTMSQKRKLSKSEKNGKRKCENDKRKKKAKRTETDSGNEIKEVRKKKDMSTELEGIDTTNIVSSSRRRSTTSFAPPSKPKITSESESDKSEDSENGEDNEEAKEGSQTEEESNNEDDVGEESK